MPSQTRGAFRGGQGKLPIRAVSAVASAMAGSTKRENSPRPHALDPRRRKFRERFERHAREAGCSLRKAFERWPGAGAFRGGSGKLPARVVSAAACTPYLPAPAGPRSPKPNFRLADNLGAIR
jgi:hypothetical protein